MAKRTHKVMVVLNDDEAAILDEHRGAVPRAVFLRTLARHVGQAAGAPEYGEALKLLAESARSGHVQAQIALERALRQAGKKEDEVGDAIERLLAAN